MSDEKVWRGWGSWSDKLNRWWDVLSWKANDKYEEIAVLPAADYDALLRELTAARDMLAELERERDENDRVIIATRNMATESLAAMKQERDAARTALAEKEADLDTALKQANRAGEIIYAMSEALKPVAGEHNIDLAKRVRVERDAAKAECEQLKDHCLDAIKVQNEAQADALTLANEVRRVENNLVTRMVLCDSLSESEARHAVVNVRPAAVTAAMERCK